MTPHPSDRDTQGWELPSLDRCPATAPGETTRVVPKGATMACSHGENKVRHHPQPDSLDEGMGEGVRQMTPTEVAAIFSSLQAAAPELASSLTIRDDVAVLRIAEKEDDTHWAEIISPGNVWFSLVLDGEFMRDVIDEDATADEARAALIDLFELGRAYVQGNYEVHLSRFLRIPTIDIFRDSGAVRINLALKKLARRVFLRS